MGKSDDMPNRALHFCNHPGCSELTDQRYCPKHQAEHEARQREDNSRYNKERGSAKERGYDELWRKVRKRYLNGHPLCEQCEKDGKTVAAVLVHHIKPISEGGDRLRVGNLMALCNDCHEAIHGKDRFKRKV